MNLWLSLQAIWYYRKVAVLPCARRKDIKKSLRTRDKLVARSKVAQLLACARSRVKPVVVAAKASAKLLTGASATTACSQPCPSVSPNDPFCHFILCTLITQ